MTEANLRFNAHLEELDSSNEDNLQVMSFRNLLVDVSWFFVFVFLVHIKITFGAKHIS